MTANELLRELVTCAGEVLNAHEIPPDTDGPLVIEPGDSNALSLAKAALLLHDLAVAGELPDEWRRG